MVTANATGSNIFVLTLVLGLASVSSTAGLSVNSTISRVDIPILLSVSLIVVLLFTRRALHRRAGLGLLALYVGYLVYALLRGA